MVCGGVAIWKGKTREILDKVPQGYCRHLTGRRQSVLHVNVIALEEGEGREKSYLDCARAYTHIIFISHFMHASSVFSLVKCII